MPKNKFAKKKDANQPEIESQLTELGVSWKDVSKNADLGYDMELYFGRYCFKVEVKNPEYLTKAQRNDLSLALTDNEKKAFLFFREQSIPYLVVTDTPMILALMLKWFQSIQNEVLFKSWFLVLQNYKKKFGETDESKHITKEPTESDRPTSGGKIIHPFEPNR